MVASTVFRALLSTRAGAHVDRNWTANALENVLKKNASNSTKSGLDFNAIVECFSVVEVLVYLANYVFSNSKFIENISWRESVRAKLNGTNLRKRKKCL